jgi:Signal transduction histidine kinase
MKNSHNSSNLQDLKERLLDELTKSDPDSSAILFLSNRIAALDEKQVRFSADAAVIRRLGRELVGRQETALAELIKNSYDADATTVDVRFLYGHSGLLGIDITDNGNGMSRTELVDGFMRLASDQKIREPRSPRFNRRRAGRKGIGRFAAERLGDKLILTTKTASSKAIQLQIDWESFTQGAYLNEIATSMTEVDWEQEYGTKLKILLPRDSWNQQQIDRVFKSISALLNPYKTDKMTGSEATEPGFLVSFFRHDTVKQQDVTVADINLEIFDHAFALVEGRIASDGTLTWSVSSKRYDLPARWVPFVSDKNEPIVLSSAKNARLRAYYYINRSDLYPTLAYASIRAQLEANGGIRLYRNGFRVLPYGEPEDDWLQLDELESRRIHSNVSLANRNFMGAIEVDDIEGHVFEETSSREGLIENAAYIELRDSFSAMLVNAARQITAVRLQEGGRSSLRPARAEEVIAEAQKAAERLATSANLEVREHTVGIAPPQAPSSDGPTPTSHHDELAKIKAGLAEAQRLTQEQAMLRSLASLGLTVAEFAHEFKHQSQFIELTAEQLKRLAPPGPISDKCDELVERVEGARDFSAYFGEMVSKGGIGERKPMELYLLARDFAEGVKPMLETPPIELIVEKPSSYDIYSTNMYRAEWASILMNLLTNSLKAIRRQRTKGRILVTTGFADASTVFLEFCDNGDGISPENRDRIFDAFFSTTGASPAGRPDLNHQLGSGLGLKIVSDIIDGVGGKVYVAEPPAGYSTSVRIEVPTADLGELE